MHYHLWKYYSPSAESGRLFPALENDIEVLPADTPFNIGDGQRGVVLECDGILCYGYLLSLRTLRRQVAGSH